MALRICGRIKYNQSKCFMTNMERFSFFLLSCASKLLITFETLKIILNIIIKETNIVRRSISFQKRMCFSACLYNFYFFTLYKKHADTLTLIENELFLFV